MNFLDQKINLRKVLNLMWFWKTFGAKCKFKKLCPCNSNFGFEGWAESHWHRSNRPALIVLHRHYNRPTKLMSTIRARREFRCQCRVVTGARNPKPRSHQTEPIPASPLLSSIILFRYGFVDSLYRFTSQNLIWSFFFFNKTSSYSYRCY